MGTLQIRTKGNKKERQPSRADNPGRKERNMMNEEYRMNEGRNAAYKYIVIDKKTNEVITSGDVTGGNKTDCGNMTWLYFNKYVKEHGLAYKPHHTANDEVRIHLHATDCGAGIKLWEKRVAKAYGQQELADIAGIDIKTLQDFESGRKDINKAAAITIKKMAKALGCQMEDLIDG